MFSLGSRTSAQPVLTAIIVSSPEPFGHVSSSLVGAVLRVEIILKLLSKIRIFRAIPKFRSPDA